MREWTRQPIENLLTGQWPGEWGSDLQPDSPLATIYRSTELDDEGHTRESCVYRDVPSIKLEAKKLVSGDILLEASGGTPGRPVGRVGLYEPERAELAICSNFLRTLRPRSDVCSAYLRWTLLFLHRQPAIWRYQQQTTGMSNLNVRAYLRHEIDVAPTGEQERIAEILSTLDEAIEQTEALIAKTQAIKAGLMRDLFTRGVMADGELRPPREQAPHLYKASPLGWIPKEWSVERCAALTELITVGIVIRPVQYYVEEGIPAFRSANIREEGICPSDLVFISPQSNALLAKSRVQTGDVLSVRTGYPGTSAVVPPEHAGANCIDILISRPSGRLRSNYLAAWVNSSFGKEQVLRKQGGLAQQHFNVGELRNLLVALPGLTEQDEIFTRISAVNGKLAEEDDLAKMYLKLKRGLMHDLLTGRVPVPLPEP